MKENRDVIVVILPRGESIRNFVYSGVTKAIRREFKVVLVSVIPNKAIEQLLLKECDELIPLQNIKLPKALNVFQGILDLAHNRYLWSKAAQVRWKIRDLESRKFSSKIVRALKKSIAICFASSYWLTWLERLDYYLAKQTAAVKQFVEVLSVINPILVFNTSHVHSKVAYPVVQAARKIGIKTSTFLFSWDNLTSQGRIIPKYDYYFVWNSSIREDLQRIYPNIKDDQIFVTGTPQFISHFMDSNLLVREDFLKSLGMKETDRYILYSAGISHHIPHEPLVVERLADLIVLKGLTIKIVVRTYSKDRSDVFEYLRNKRPDVIIPSVAWEKNWFTPLPSDSITLANLLRHCELGINVASTISLELCMFNKPAINIAYNPPGKNIYPYDYTRFYEFDHYKPIAQSGAISVANSEEQVIDYIEQYLQNHNQRSEERKALISKMFGENLNNKVIDNFMDAVTKCTKGCVRHD